MAFQSERDGARNLYWRRADGTDEVERLTSSPADQRAYGWTPDGSLLFTEDGDIWSLAVEPGAVPVPLMQEAYVESEPALSPGGRFISVQSEELGYPEIFVRSFPDLMGKWLVSTLDIAPMSGLTNADLRDGRSALWSRDGEEIYYLSGNAIVRVPVSTEGTFTHGTPEVLFERRGRGSVEGPHYDVSRSGERFLMIERLPAREARNELIVVQNWRDLLGSQAPN